MNNYYSKRLSIQLFSAVLFVFLISEVLVSPAQSATQHKATFSNKDVFRTAVFIKNNGVVENNTGETILYHVNHGNVNAFFTPNGIFYKISSVDAKERAERKEESKESKEGRDDDDKGIPMQATVVKMQWLGANPNPEIEEGQQEEGYYTYLKKEKTGYKGLTAYGYKTITYKNMYPGVDIVYSLPQTGLPEGWKTGMKYNLVVHPGADVSKIKMAYDGPGIQSIQKDKDGNIVVTTTCGNIIERSPVSFLEDNSAVSSGFTVSGNNINFSFPKGYNTGKTLTIDPWVNVLGELPPTDMGFDVNYDFTGNVFIYGAGPTDLYDAGDYFEVAKYDASGNVLWTFNGSVPAIGWNSETQDGFYDVSIPSNFIVDKTNGKVYVGKGFDGSGTGTATIRLNINGIYDNFESNPDADFLETWAFAYNCASGSILALGGGLSSDINMGVINTTTGATSNSNITGITNGYYYDYYDYYGQDILCGTYDNAGNLYVIMNSLTPGQVPYTNTIYRVNNTYNGYTWVANSDYSSFSEVNNDVFWDPADPDQGNAFNALAANGSYLFYYDGYNVAAYNLNNGSMVGTPYNIAGYATLYQGGIDVDNCNHVYVGGDGVIKTFTFNGANFVPGADIPLGNGFEADRIHDVRYNASNNLLYVTGDYIVGTYTATLSGACVAPNSFTATAFSRCDSATVHVSPNAGLSPDTFSYVWTDTAGNIVRQTINSGDTINSVTLSNGTYIVQVQWNSNCGGYAIYDTVTIMQTNLTHSHDTTICVGQSATLSGHATGAPGTYSWTPGGDTTASITVTPDTTTTYTVTYTPSNCNPITATIVVTVHPVPTLSVNDTTFCNGGHSVTLVATPSYTGGTYHWSVGGITTQSITVSPTTTTTYSVTYTTSCGTVTASGTVTITPAPTITTTNDTICSGGTAQVTATPSVGGGTYLWSPGGFTTSTISVSPTVNTTYTVTYSTPGCNNATATASVIITPPPTLTTTGASICTGNPALISATPSIGGGSYSWSPSGDTTGTITVSPGNTTTYTVTYDLSGCSDVTATATVTVTPKPSVVAVGATTFCEGDTALLTATPEPGGGTFIWQPGGATTSSVSVVPAATTTYIVNYTLNGCSASDSVTVTVHPMPIIALVITNASCAMQNGKIVASASGATPNYSYFWSNLPDVSTPVDSALAAGTYTLHVFDELGCSASVSVSIAQSSAVAAADSVKTFPCAQPPYGNVVITAIGGASPYTFVVPGVGTDTTGVFTNVAPGTYPYTITDSTGCPVTDTFTVPSGYAKDSFDIGADSTSCFGVNDGKVIVIPIDTPNAPYSYALNGGTPQSGTVFDSLAGGGYQVIVYNGIGCNDTLNSVTVYQPAPVSVSFVPDTIDTYNGDTVPLNPTVSNFVSPIYAWSPTQGLSCTTCSSTMATIDEAVVVPPVVYYVRVSDSLNANCSAYDSVIILIKGQFAMPSAFTPNGDGKNDLFGPAKYSYLTIKEFHIYDRWGQLVHNSTEYWDGKFKGKDQPEGTYVYYIVVEYPDQVNPGKLDTGKKEGSVVLLR